jgi:hypothetical protein
MPTEQEQKEYIEKMDADLRKWYKMSVDLKKLKNDEMSLRKKICKSLFGEGVRDEDKTIKFGMPSGISVQATSKVSIKIDEAVLREIYGDLSLSEQSAVVYKPNLVMAGYKALAKDSLFHEAISIQPASPTLKVVIPDGD